LHNSSKILDFCFLEVEKRKLSVIMIISLKALEVGEAAGIDITCWKFSYAIHYFLRVVLNSFLNLLVFATRMH